MTNVNLKPLATEQVDKRLRALDTWSALKIVTAMNRGDAYVVKVVKMQLPHIAQAINLSVERLSQGGRLIYVGAGTSGRLGVLDASECPPTFGVSPNLVRGVIAGGSRALVRSSEGAEDNVEAGERALRKLHLRAHDVVVGIAASGRTPYVVGAMTHAQRVGAARIALVNSLPSPIAARAEIVIAPVTGAEIVSGSTRLKAGTAQKLVLNMLSTATFVRLGKVYCNWMVSVQASNEKLQARATRIVCEATGLTEARARRVLKQAHWEVKTAIVMQLTDVNATEARRRLKVAKGFVRQAIRQT
jgi:N-acetylmuramic acid 6-phosphate etherase